MFFHVSQIIFQSFCSACCPFISCWNQISDSMLCYVEHEIASIPLSFHRIISEASSFPRLGRLLQPGTQRTPKCKITWDLDQQGPTCTQELGSATAICAPILPGDIFPAGSPAFRGSPTFSSETTIFAPVTEQTGAPRNAENTLM